MGGTKLNELTRSFSSLSVCILLELDLGLHVRLHFLISVLSLHCDNTTRIENSFCSFWERFQSLKVHRWKSKYLTRQQIGITEIFELLTITSRPNCLYKHLPFLFFLKGEFTFFSPSFHRKIDNTHDYQRNYKQPRRLFSCFFFPFNQKQTSDLKRINKT